VECEEDASRCTKTARERCIDGAWTAAPACDGTAVCSNGVCGSLKATGTLVTSSGLARSGGTITVSDHGFQISGGVCGTVRGTRVCATGALNP
jgi:hypothetical protein